MWYVLTKPLSIGNDNKLMYTALPGPLEAQSAFLVSVNSVNVPTGLGGGDWMETKSLRNLLQGHLGGSVG